MIKDIILHLERDPSRDIVRDFAASAAEMFAAHLTGVCFAFTASIPTYIVPNFPAGILANILAESETAARGAIDRFEAAMKRDGISAEPRLVLQTEFGPSRTFSEMARCFDLSIIMQSEHYNGIDNSTLIEATLFDSGRPLIVVPYIQQDGLKLDRVVCCWDGSRAAVQAHRGAADCHSSYRRNNIGRGGRLAEPYRYCLDCPVLHRTRCFSGAKGGEHC
jgi:hypothetical protein